MTRRAKSLPVKIYLPPELGRALDLMCAEYGITRSELGRAAILDYVTRTPPWARPRAPLGGTEQGTGPSLGPPVGDQLPLSDFRQGPPPGPPDGPPRAGARSGSGGVYEGSRSHTLSGEGPDSGDRATVERHTARLTELVNRVAGTQLVPTSPAAVRALGLRLGHQVGGERLADGDKPDTFSNIEDTCRGIAERWSAARITLTAILGPKYWDHHAVARAPKTTMPAPGSSPGAERAARRRRAKR